MTSLATAQIIGIVLLASPFVQPSFRDMASLSASCFIELNVASVSGSYLVFELSVVRASAVVRASTDCLAGFSCFLDFLFPIESSSFRMPMY